MTADPDAVRQSTTDDSRGDAAGADDMRARGRGRSAKLLPPTDPVGRSPDPARARLLERHGAPADDRRRRRRLREVDARRPRRRRPPDRLVHARRRPTATSARSRRDHRRAARSACPRSPTTPSDCGRELDQATDDSGDRRPRRQAAALDRHRRAPGRARRTTWCSSSTTSTSCRGVRGSLRVRRGPRTARAGRAPRPRRRPATDVPFAIVDRLRGQGQVLGSGRDRARLLGRQIDALLYALLGDDRDHADLRDVAATDPRRDRRLAGARSAWPGSRRIGSPAVTAKRRPRPSPAAGGPDLRLPRRGGRRRARQRGHRALVRSAVHFGTGFSAPLLAAIGVPRTRRHTLEELVESRRCSSSRCRARPAGSRCTGLIRKVRARPAAAVASRDPRLHHARRRAGLEGEAGSRRRWPRSSRPTTPALARFLGRHGGSWSCAAPRARSSRRRRSCRSSSASRRSSEPLGEACLGPRGVARALAAFGQAVGPDGRLDAGDGVADGRGPRRPRRPTARPSRSTLGPRSTAASRGRRGAARGVDRSATPTAATSRRAGSRRRRPSRWRSPRDDPRAMAAAPHRDGPAPRARERPSRARRPTTRPRSWPRTERGRRAAGRGSATLPGRAEVERGQFETALEILDEAVATRTRSALRRSTPGRSSTAAGRSRASAGSRGDGRLHRGPRDLRADPGRRRGNGARPARLDARAARRRVPRPGAAFEDAVRAAS